MPPYHQAITAEAQHLQALPARRSEDYEEVSVRVTATSGFTLRRVFTSVPTRLIGHRRSARVHADHIALTLGTDHCLTVPRKHHRTYQCIRLDSVSVVFMFLLFQGNCSPP